MNYNEITYPSPFNSNRAIGVTAPSSGVSEPAHLKRLDLIISQMKDRGIDVIEGKCLRRNVKHVSDTARARAADFESMWQREDVGAIVPPWGGELLIEILEHIDFESFKNKSNAKWVLGYSDTSTLLFALTMLTGIATAHGSNLIDLIANQVYDITDNYLRFLATPAGGQFEQSNFLKFQSKWPRFEDKVDTTFTLHGSIMLQTLKDRTLGAIIAVTSSGEMPKGVRHLLEF